MLASSKKNAETGIATVRTTTRQTTFMIIRGNRAIEASRGGAYGFVSGSVIALRKAH